MLFLFFNQNHFIILLLFCLCIVSKLKKLTPQVMQRNLCKIMLIYRGYTFCFSVRLKKRKAQNESSGCSELLSKFNRKHSSSNFSFKRCVTTLFLVCCAGKHWWHQCFSRANTFIIICSLFLFPVQNLFCQVAVKNKLSSALNSAGIRAVYKWTVCFRVSR